MFKKKSQFIIACVLAITFIVSIFACFMINSTPVYAASSTVLSDSDYTDSDRLIMPDGTNSDNKISDFALEVKTAANGTSFPEISQVIPVQYLESTESKAVYSYNGKEYGFYVEKDNDIFNLLLLDFYYDFGGVTKNNEYIIGVNPILQQAFSRKGTAGNYQWVKCDSEYSYYISNPQIIVALYNENNLNSFDDGYSKQNDDGLIIQQTRANFGDVQFSYEFEHEMDSVGETIVQGVVDVLGMSIEGLGDIVTIFEYLGKLGNTIDNDIILEEELTVHDNEKYISTKLSKSDQLNNVNVDSFSRFAAFTYKSNLANTADTYSNFIFLSDDNKSYFEYIVQLNDTNYRSRLMQLGSYYLTKIYSGNSDKTIEFVVNEDNNLQQFYFAKDSVLFDDYNITTLSNKSISEQGLVYILPNGNQKFTYNCNDTTIYQIISEHTLPDIKICNGNQQVQPTKVNDNIVEFLLESGNCYSFILSQKEAA